MKALFTFLLVQAVAVFTSQAQEILNASGGYVSMGTSHHDYSICEMVLIETYSLGSTQLTQGLLQPIGKAIITGTGSGGLFPANNFLTPNGDGKNDVLFFESIELYPDNSLKIFDRAGRLLWKTKNYQNDWNGLVNGKPLNEDTYYYIFEPGPGYGPVKRFVSIIYDQSKRR